MRVPRLAAGVVCLGLAATAGWWGWQHRAWHEKVRGPGQQTLKAADLVAKGPGDAHAVRLTNVELGEPILIPRGPNESPDVWFPVYPAGTGKRKGPPIGPPHVLFHTRYALSSPEAAVLFRQNSEVSGTVLNGLPSADLELPPEVTAAHSRLDPAAVWIVRGDRLWQEGAIYWTAALAATFGLLGVWLAAGGLFGQPGKRRARETRSLPELRPLDAQTASRAKRAYYHSKCGSNTLASGDDLVRLECPFRGCSRTYCCGCARFVPLAAVQWEDTGEGLVEYRERIAGVVPFWKRVRLSWLGNAYAGAVNLGLDTDGRVVQPLRDPPGWPRPSPAFRPAAARR
jgi:hypothetical protein